MHVIGLDLGGTKLTSAIFNEEGNIIFKHLVQIEKRKGIEVSDLTITQIQNLLKDAESNGLDIKSIGLSVPGIVYPNSDNVWVPNIKDWKDFPLKKYLNEKFPNYKITIESDRACYILGEIWRGSAKGCKNAIFIAVGTGIGAGILVDGKILNGNGGISGAIGWLALNKPYHKKYKDFGCYEFNASGDGIGRVAKELLTKTTNYKGELSYKEINSITSYDIFEAYDADDPIAIDVIKQAIEYWGMNAANLVSIFNPEKIIFGGGVFGPAVRFLPEIKKEAKKWAQPISIKQVSIESSTLGGDAGLIGAGKLAIDQVKTK